MKKALTVAMAILLLLAVATPAAALGTGREKKANDVLRFAVSWGVWNPSVSEWDTNWEVTSSVPRQLYACSYLRDVYDDGSCGQIHVGPSPLKRIYAGPYFPWEAYYFSLAEGAGQTALVEMRWHSREQGGIPGPHIEWQRRWNGRGWRYQVTVVNCTKNTQFITTNMGKSYTRLAPGKTYSRSFISFGEVRLLASKSMGQEIACVWWHDSSQLLPLLKH